MLDNIKKMFGAGWQAPAPAPSMDGMSFVVAGVEYRIDALISLATEQKRYKMPVDKLKGFENKKLYKYFFDCGSIDLVPEPLNPHDKNAIKVMINGQHVGYVPRNECELVKSFLAVPCVVSCSVSGGEYKKITEAGAVGFFADPYVVTVKIKKG